MNRALILFRCFITDGVVTYLYSRETWLTFWSNFNQRWYWLGPELQNTVPFIFQLQMKFATLIAAFHCFSHRHVLYIFNMICLLTVLLCYPPFVVDAFSLGSQHVALFWMDGRVLFFLYCLVIFLSDQLQIDHSSHFKLLLTNSCICGIMISVELFLFGNPSSTLSPPYQLVTKSSTSQCLYHWKHLLTIDFGVWSALSSK